jgi:hypothetical protein
MIAERAYFATLATQAKSDIHNSFRLRTNHHSSFDKVSYERRLWPRASSQIKSKKKLPLMHSYILDCGSGF